MTDFDDLARRYLAAWNETDPAARRERVTALWGPQGWYVDPLAEARGHDEIDALIAGAQERFPGFRFRLLGEVDGHHAQLRFRWGLGPDGAGAPEDDPIVGFDVVTLDDRGRLDGVLGFLDRVPAAT